MAVLTKSEAIQIVNNKLEEMTETAGQSLIVIEDRTLETSFGWVFFYDSNEFLETNDIQFAIAGNGPVLVDKHSGLVAFHGSGNPSSCLIAEYEEKVRSQN